MNKFPKELRIPFDKALLPEDTEEQTYGCRHTNPDICGTCCLEGVCAFVDKDHVCKRPSVKWKKKYKELRGK